MQLKVEPLSYLKEWVITRIRNSVIMLGRLRRFSFAAGIHTDLYGHLIHRQLTYP